MALKSGYSAVTGYKHIQATESDTWVIDHNIGANNNAVIPIVDVYVIVNSVQQKIIPLEITVTTPSQLTVTFSQVYSGFALLFA